METSALNIKIPKKESPPTPFIAPQDPPWSLKAISGPIKAVSLTVFPMAEQSEWPSI